MERDNFNPYSFESSDEKSDDKKEDSKKKAKSVTGLGKLLARQEQPKEADKPLNKEERSFLQKLAGESVKVEAEPKAEQQEEIDREVPLEELSEAEQAEAAQAYIQARAQELGTEADGGEAPAETDADATFLAALHDRLAETEESGDIETVIEQAYDDAVAEIADEVIGEPAEEAFQLNEPQAFEQDEAVALSGSSGRPPMPPVRLAGGGFAERPEENAPAPFAMRPHAGAVGGERRYDDIDVQRIERNAAGRGLLVGSIVGYLIGRRRGRIKTEKRLKGVQEKLEKQVVAVQQKIEEKESAIRRLAREKAAAVTSSTAATTVERASTFTPRAPEASQTASVSERLTQRSSPETSGVAKPAGETAKVTVDTLSKEELLAYSSQIRVGETSLRRVFEAKMVDEKGLRRLIKEYQAGHDLRRALAREFMVKELRFERDPTLRDLLPPETQPRKQAGNKAERNDYGEGGAAADVSGASSQTDGTRSDAAIAPAKPAAPTQARSRHRQENVSPTLLVALTLITIGLAVYAVWLTLTK